MNADMRNMRAKLSYYVNTFNEHDEELYRQCVSNEQAEAFLGGQIPLIECPDEDIEQAYYFRWWTFRKHFKSTEKGHIITEFLPSVKWAGPYNSIVCPACLHIREGRWLRDPEHWVKQYIDFWLSGCGKQFAYSSWLAYAVLEYCRTKNDFGYAVDKLPELVAFFEQREVAHRRECGLYWSKDGRDGMEYSISGSGFRPTLNSYACADALAISSIAEMAGQDGLSRWFADKAGELKELIDRQLWRDGFYRTIPAQEEQQHPGQTPQERDARELLGYIPWYFGLPGEDKNAAFKELLTEDGFKVPFGLTTAERRHPLFLKEFSHECLWNGPIWPFASSQTLVAIANLLRGQPQSVITKDDYFAMLLQYARSQRLVREDGSVILWIDEDLHPFTGRWITRDLLKRGGWEEGKGGYERGKDYNHSLFCDLVLDGLFGIRVENGKFTAQPLVPDSWEYFRVENLYLDGARYSVIFDKTGEKYGRGAGLSIRRAD